MVECRELVNVHTKLKFIRTALLNMQRGSFFVPAIDLVVNQYNAADVQFSTRPAA